MTRGSAFRGGARPGARRTVSNGRLASVLLAGAAVLLAGCGGSDAASGGDGARVVTPAPSRPATTSQPTPTPSPSEATAAAPTPGLDQVQLALEPVIEGLSSPTLVTAPPGDDRLFVLEQPGRVLLRDGGELTTFLDLTDQVVSGGERGLLGMAFAPDFATDGRFFLHYSGDDGRTTLSEFRVGEDGAAAQPGSEQVLLTVSQPAPNHNGGTVLTGPDGMLYLGLGDGGAANDRFDNGQDPSTLLGTILRLDVSTPGEYAIPADNPFVDGGGAPEVWVYGLRNPYRFDLRDGQLIIGDVGQNEVEEIDALSLDEAPGANFGWPILEGSRCFQSDDCDRSGLVAPVAEYTHEQTGGCAVIGGPIYAGEAIPALAGHAFYGDLCAGFVRSLRVEDGEVVAERDWTEQIGPVGRLLSFGTDGRGEPYLTTADGTVFALVPA